jgi:hypothetical protein
MPVLPKESSPDPEFARAIAAVNGKFTDPQSASYGDMVRKVGPNLNGKPAEVVCGSVNAKDSLGRNDGKRPFVYFIADAATFLVRGKNPLAGCVPARSDVADKSALGGSGAKMPVPTPFGYPQRT